MNKLLCIFLFLGVGFCFHGYTQVTPCATEVSTSQQTLEISIDLPENDSVKSTTYLHKTVSLVFHVVKDLSGNTTISEQFINNAIAGANIIFGEVGLNFQNCRYNTIENHQYDVINKSTTESKLVSKHNMPSRLNVYIVSILYDSDGNQTCGYTYMPADEKDILFLSKQCFLNDSLHLAHQLGHVFNLYGTHIEDFGKETVGDNDCSHTGDRCCDTPADPNLSGLVDENCTYMGEMVDENGEFYVPSVSNLMSFSNRNCRCQLTPDQYKRVIHAYKNYKKYLW